MSSAGAKDQFLRQMEQIVEGIKQSRIKVRRLYSSFSLKGFLCHLSKRSRHLQVIEVLIIFIGQIYSGPDVVSKDCF